MKKPCPEKSKLTFLTSTQSWLKKLFWKFEAFVDRPWFEWALAVVVFVDVFVMFIPVDALLITSAISCPRKWIRLALFTALGYTLGAVGFCYVVDLLGWPFLNQYFPSLAESAGWRWTQAHFQVYGMWVVFLVALAPVFQHPALIVAALAQHPLFEIFWVVLIGRIIKYFVMTYMCRFAPKLLKRFRYVRSELKLVGNDKL